jgi:uncharacterized protein
MTAKPSASCSSDATGIWMSDATSPLSKFEGIARLFPLPNVVLFPQVMLPLHIFELRYRQMTAEALAGDRLIAMTLLKPGWESDYEGRPPLYPIACLGRIVADQQLEDDRYNILLRGLQRIRILSEVTNDRLFRTARVRLLKEVPVADPAREDDFRHRLSLILSTWLATLGSTNDQVTKLLQSKLPMGTLCDLLGFTLPFEISFKQALLAETSVKRRAGRLLHFLETHQPPCIETDSRLSFPPEFSDN